STTYDPFAWSPSIRTRKRSKLTLAMSKSGRAARMPLIFCTNLSYGQAACCAGEYVVYRPGQSFSALKSAWLRTTASTAAWSPVGVLSACTALLVAAGVSSDAVGAAPCPEEQEPVATLSTANAANASSSFPL